MGASCSSERASESHAKPAEVNLVNSSRAVPVLNKPPVCDAPPTLEAASATLETPLDDVTSSEASLGEAWRVVPRVEAVGDGGGHADLFLGPDGFCVVQPEGHRSHASCTAVLDALKSMRVTPAELLVGEKPAPNTVRRLQTAIEEQLPSILALSNALSRGELSELQAARELLSLIGSYELRIAVVRAIGNGNNALLRARHQNRALTRHESSARSLRNSGRMMSPRLPSARGVERDDSHIWAAALTPRPASAPTPNAEPPAPFACRTHEGGAGGLGKENQVRMRQNIESTPTPICRGDSIGRAL